MTQEARTVFQVIETATGAVVRTIDVTGKSERDMDRVEMGLYRNMDLDRFHVEGPHISLPQASENGQ